MSGKREKRPWLWYLLAAALVAADQLVKLWVRGAMELGETRAFIPHFIEFYHLQNTGGAFSLLAGQTWVLTALSAVAAVALVVCLWGDYVTSNSFSRLCVTCVLAGAVGNLIDRALFGAVTDMFNFTFITFGVFNVADMWVVGGVIGYCGYLLWEQFANSPTRRTFPEQPGQTHREPPTEPLTSSAAEEPKPTGLPEGPAPTHREPPIDPLTGSTAEEPNPTDLMEESAAGEQVEDEDTRHEADH